MSRQNHIAKLYQHFVGPFLTDLATPTTSVIDSLLQNRCKVTRTSPGIAVEFSLEQLFSAVWCHGKMNGVELSESSNWDKEIKEFHRQLNALQPEPFSRKGLRWQLLHKSSNHAFSTYSIKGFCPCPNRKAVA